MGAFPAEARSVEVTVKVGRSRNMASLRRTTLLVVATVCLAALLLGGAMLARLWKPAPAAGRPSPTAAAPAHFGTLAPGTALPSAALCGQWALSVSAPETKRVNLAFNQATGHSVGKLFPVADDSKANQLLAPRIDGNFTGATLQILRWAACKWGIDEDLVAAQAALESWWRQTSLGDWGTDPNRCPPGHGLGLDGMTGRCPQSFGILQNRYPFEVAAWPGIARSTAMNADVAYAIWRACYEGYELWLNDVERVGRYAAGDAWGCIGRWFAGRWHTSAAERYIGKVKDYLSQRIWQEAGFQEP